MRPEIQLLLDCASTRLPAARAHRIRHLTSAKLDWETLTSRSAWHGVLPLLCDNLTRVCADTAPADRLAQLQMHFRANSIHNLALTAELLNLLRLLDDEGMTGIPFKGPTLAATAYGNLGLRQFSDLDILVPEVQFPAAKELFLGAGYRPWKQLTAQEEASHLRSYHAYTLVRVRDGLRLDLHWRITQERYAFGLDVESLWSRARRLPICGQKVLQLAPEDLLTVLCIHGSKHCWERLGWICDIAEVIRSNPQLRWDEILSRSESLGISRAVLLGVDLAATLLDAPLPKVVDSRIQRDRAAQDLSRIVQRRLFRRRGKIGPFEEAVLIFLTQTGVRSRIPHLFYSFQRLVKPSDLDLDLLTLPTQLHFLYYPLRFARLTRAAVLQLFGRVN